ncbi:hypothetical protein EVAR_82357_1 [Eumeta japonica]|uniref:Uncharacterized protein n=1 Tax=Eumeta variegata TaxID=151549 RepID=A0A4C1U9Y1_EUMVA|nr:hypothetical protein EVAR_82357_1 [Eumeta japonica]
MQRPDAEMARAGVRAAPLAPRPRPRPRRARTANSGAPAAAALPLVIPGAGVDPSPQRCLRAFLAYTVHLQQEFFAKVAGDPLPAAALSSSVFRRGC